jgi:hypothetical protein
MKHKYLILLYKHILDSALSTILGEKIGRSESGLNDLMPNQSSMNLHLDRHSICCDRPQRSCATTLWVI